MGHELKATANDLHLVLETFTVAQMANPQSAIAPMRAVAELFARQRANEQERAQKSFKSLSMRVVQLDSAYVRLKNDPNSPEAVSELENRSKDVREIIDAARFQ